MIRSIILLALTAPLAWSQFNQIATTDDGRQIYFTTTLIERTTPDALPESRIYRINDGRLELFTERGDLARRDGFGSGDGAQSLNVSADGQSVAFVLWNVCPPGDQCRTTQSRAEVRGRYAQTFDQAQSINMSRDGRWALVTPFRMFEPGQNPNAPIDSTLINLETGSRTTIARAPGPDEPFILASDGSVLLRTLDAQGRNVMGIWRNGELQPLPPISGPVAFLGISDDASTLVGQRIIFMPPEQPRTEIVAVDLRTGTVRTITHEFPVGRWNLLGLSNDGARALFGTFGPTGPGPAYIANLRAGTLELIGLPEGERPVAGALSGDSNLAVLGTTAGRLLRLAGRTIEELLPPTPYVPEFARPFAPGLRYDITPPLPGNIDWTGRIRINGLPIVILGRTPQNRLDVQIPWELPIGPATAEIDYAQPSPLMSRDRSFVAPAAPSMPTTFTDTRAILFGRLLRADFSGYVTDPLRPGDIVHMYFTGLGAVQGSVQTGMPAPLNELRPLVTTPQCSFLPGERGAETLFAGLAPGMVGIYQVTLRVAENTPPVPNGMACRFGGGFFSFSGTIMP